MTCDKLVAARYEESSGSGQNQVKLYRLTRRCRLPFYFTGRHGCWRAPVVLGISSAASVAWGSRFETVVTPISIYIEGPPREFLAMQIRMRLEPSVSFLWL